MVQGTDKGSSRTSGQRKAFVRELEAMTRLRSPHTVNVFGAVTCRSDRLILVMELLPGGDLRSFLKRSANPLPEERSRDILEDISAGMAFLHSKSTIHGDLKSANVLFDGAGRVKVRSYYCHCPNAEYSRAWRRNSNTISNEFRTDSTLPSASLGASTA